MAFPASGLYPLYPHPPVAVRLLTVAANSAPPNFGLGRLLADHAPNNAFAPIITAIGTAVAGLISVIRDAPAEK